MTNEREELHKVIWSMANDLRGAVDGWDFKSYVLGFLFYRYLSENFSEFINNNQKNSGKENFNYADLTDKVAEKIKSKMIKIKGYFIYPSQLFENVLKNCDDDKNLNITLSSIFKDIENSSIGTPAEDDFKGLFNDIDVNNPNKLGATLDKRCEKLRAILKNIGKLKLTASNNKIDAFGDAYEYLMTMYASSAGKSGGEFYTPQEVSKLLTKIVVGNKTDIENVYDPTCGSGSLLLQAAKLLGNDHISDGYYGQELNPTTYNLCRINMFLHNIPYDKMSIKNDDTLTAPKHLDKKFECIVSNPPYSISWVGDNDTTLINDVRYSPAGVLAPKSKADLAFLMHVIHQLKENGTAAIVCFPGIFYRGGAEQKIRKYLIENNFVDAVIELPGNIFFGTSIVTDIIVLKKNKTTKDILFINASKHFVHATNNDVLSEQNIDEIYKLYTDRKDTEESIVVSNDDVLSEKNDASLAVSNYISLDSEEEIIDINNLNIEIDTTVALIQTNRNKINKIIKGFEKDGTE